MNILKLKGFFLACVCLTACAHHSNLEQSSLLQNEPAKAVITDLGALPLPIANNAVASATVNGKQNLYSFLGLEAGKDWLDVSKKAFRYADGQWSRLDDVPVPQGRLASIAVTVRNQIYLFGGYTVAEDHSEVSTPEVLRFDPASETYQRVADIPVPSDDASAFVYLDRYIYLVSGWHDKGNINLVQVYDVQTDTWQQATQFPGSPVFGHAGGIVANEMLICDGVKIDYPQVTAGQEAKRQFTMSDECYLGRIDEKDVFRIHWAVVPRHPGAARYRMASIGDVSRKQVVFAGGSDNPYNFNGIGYDGVPSQPVASMFAFDMSDNQWVEYAEIAQPTMDHRGLLKVGDTYVVIGGMDADQIVLDRSYQIKLSEK